MDNSCKPQSGCSAEALSLEEIQKELMLINQEWKLDLNQPNKIFREFKFKNFSQALAFVNKVAIIAEKLNHHPDITLKWGYVKVEFWTHTSEGLGLMDFKAALELDACV